MKEKERCRTLNLKRGQALKVMLFNEKGDYETQVHIHNEPSPDARIYYFSHSGMIAEDCDCRIERLAMHEERQIRKEAEDEQEAI